VDPKLTLEMAFIRLLQVEPALSLDVLIEKIDMLQKGIRHALSAFPQASAQAHPGLMKTEPFISSPVSDYKPIPINPGIEEIREDVSLPGIGSDQPTLKNDGMRINAADPIENKKSIDTIWGDISEILSREHPSLAACFSDSHVTGTVDHEINIEFISNQFNINYALRDDNRLLLSKLWNEHMGRETKLSLIAKPIPGGDMKKKEKKLLHEDALNNPLVTKAIKLFNGKIVDIKIL
jgi:DNA polymerase-3 subunit gamma/tau